MGIGQGMDEKGESQGPKSQGMGRVTPPGPATFSAVETIWGRSGLSVHSSWKAFILHIWTRTLQSKAGTSGETQHQPIRNNCLFP